MNTDLQMKSHDCFRSVLESPALNSHSALRHLC